MLRLSGLKVLFAIVVTCMILHIFLLKTAFASTDPISISSDTSNMTFPKSVDFHMSARDTSNTIIHATLYLEYNSEGYSEQHDIDINKPQRAVQVNWHEDTSGTNYSAVGTVITYYWRILDSAGNAHNEQQHKFSISDTRFHWQHLNTGFLQVNWYGKPKSFGQAVLGQADQTLQHIQKNLGTGLTQPVNLWIYGEALDFHNALPPQAHEWVGGIAFPALNQASIVVYDVNDETLVRDMPHELTHLVFHQISGTNNNVPLWFDEGLAVYNQFYHEMEMTRRFKQALSFHTLIHLNDIAFEFPADASKAYLAYGESWKLVDYMYSKFGSSKMIHLIQDLRNPGINWNDDLNKNIGMDQEHLENQWYISLNQSVVLRENQASVPLKISRVSEPMTSDPLAPLLLTAGLLMVILPIFGFSGLMLYWKSTRKREKMQYEIEKVLSASFFSQPGREARSFMGSGEEDFWQLPETPQETWFGEQQEDKRELQE
jgi:Peptidase MA superfamily